MTKLIDELEIALDRVVKEKCETSYSPKSFWEQYVYEKFSEWLVQRFKEEHQDLF